MGEYNKANDAWSVQLKEKNNHMMEGIYDTPKQDIEGKGEPVKYVSRKRPVEKRR